MTASAAPSVATALILASSVLAAQTSSDAPQSPPRELLAHQVTVNGSPELAGQLVRLPLGIEVLEATQADLSDLRLYQGDQQLSHFVRKAPPESRTLLRTVEADLLPDASQRVNSASAEVPSDLRESYRLTPPPGASGTRSQHDWQLRLDISGLRSRFVAQVRLSLVTADTNSNDQTAVRPLYEGTVYRLGDGREHLVVPLPNALEPAQALRVDLERQLRDGDSEPLQPRFHYESFEHFEAASPGIEFAVSPQIETGAHGALYRFELPSGLVPDALRLDTSRGNFDRSVRVFGISRSAFDRPQDADRQLMATDRIYRFRSADRVSEPKLEIALPNTSTTAFEIEIDGHDAPPLEGLSITALVRQPEIIFEWPADASANTPIELLFGGGRVAPARFDLWTRSANTVASALPQTVAGADRMEVITQLDGTGLSTVTLGEIKDNPRFDRTPLLAFLQRPGAQVDPTVFAYKAALDLEPNDVGLHVVLLPPQVQALLRDDRGDLRFVDDDGQWPYLLRSGGKPWQLELNQTSSQLDRQTQYEFSPSDFGVDRSRARLEAESLQLEIAASFFDRSYTLEARSAEGVVLGTTAGRLTPGTARSAFYEPSRTRSKVTIQVPGARAYHLRLVVDDGDDAPLEIETANLIGGSLSALLVAPPGAYTALFGATRDALPKPSYEVDRARSVVLSLRGSTAQLGDVQATGHSAPWFAQRWQSILLWSAIVIAIAGLGWATLRSVS